MVCCFSHSGSKSLAPPVSEMSDSFFYYLGSNCRQLFTRAHLRALGPSSCYPPRPPPFISPKQVCIYRSRAFAAPSAISQLYLSTHFEDMSFSSDSSRFRCRFFLSSDLFCGCLQKKIYVFAVVCLLVSCNQSTVIKLYCILFSYIPEETSAHDTAG